MGYKHDFTPTEATRFLTLDIQPICEE